MATAALIGGTALAAWLLSPQVDPRLVGEWVNVAPAEFAAYRRFNTDGTHSLSPRFPGGGGWAVSGDTLIFTENLPPFSLTGSLRRTWIAIVNRIRMGGPTREQYTILEVTPTMLRIQSQAGLAPVEVYRRKSIADSPPESRPPG
ncbi:hypothetical protein Pan44_13880 [Caulifigura coniformis]|uniref:Lipocalin-like domain-containing protein n=2 Tax=Caulifigura coniformis TaxID=2527983 RepID=A0A517SB48_9PLAN|nr:hypothetical protein Pan44_13880 [Caulifigura coniformis]